MNEGVSGQGWHKCQVDKKSRDQYLRNYCYIPLWIPIEIFAYRSLPFKSSYRFSSSHYDRDDHTCDFFSMTDLIWLPTKEYALLQDRNNYLFLDVGLFFNDIAQIAVLLCQFNYKVETKFNWSCNKLFNEWITLKGVTSTNNIIILIKCLYK